MVKNLVIVERENACQEAASEAAGSGEWRLSLYPDPFQALSKIVAKSPHVVVVATKVGPMTGYEFVHRLRQVPGAFEIPAIIAGPDVDERLASGLAGTTLVRLPVRQNEFREILKKIAPEDGGSDFQKEFEDVFGGIFEEEKQPEPAAPPQPEAPMEFEPLMGSDATVEPVSGGISMPGFMATAEWSEPAPNKTEASPVTEETGEPELETFDFSEEETGQLQTSRYWEAPEAAAPPAAAEEFELDFGEESPVETSPGMGTAEGVESGLEIIEQAEPGIEAIAEAAPGMEIVEVAETEPQAGAEGVPVEEAAVTGDSDDSLNLDLTDEAAAEAEALLQEFLRDDEVPAPAAEEAAAEAPAATLEFAEAAPSDEEGSEPLETIEAGENGGAEGFDVLEPSGELAVPGLVADLEAAVNDYSRPDETQCVLCEGVPEEADNLAEVPLTVSGDECFDVAAEEAGPLADMAPIHVPDLSAAVAAALESAIRKALSPEAVSALVAERIERIIWEVVPPLAEKLISEAIEKTMNPPPEE